MAYLAGILLFYMGDVMLTVTTQQGNAPRSKPAEACHREGSRPFEAPDWRIRRQNPKRGDP